MFFPAHDVIEDRPVTLLGINIYLGLNFDADSQAAGFATCAKKVGTNASHLASGNLIGHICSRRS